MTENITYPQTRVVIILYLDFPNSYRYIYLLHELITSWEVLRDIGFPRTYVAVFSNNFQLNEKSFVTRPERTCIKNQTFAMVLQVSDLSFPMRVYQKINLVPHIKNQ